jgi:hypothetical protein
MGHRGTHQTKQRTVSGRTIKITNRTWMANHAGYFVRADGKKKYHLNVLTWDEAFKIAEERLAKDIMKEERLQAVKDHADHEEHFCHRCWTGLGHVTTEEGDFWCPSCDDGVLAGEALDRYDMEIKWAQEDMEKEWKLLMGHAPKSS